MGLKLHKTYHSYYCSESNYYVGGDRNYGRCDYKTWKAFKKDWYGPGCIYDDDLNHVFRFDITENEDVPGTFGLWLFFVLQRKGIYRPVYIKTISEKDMPEIERFLSDRWKYLKSQWEEFSKEVL